MALCCELFPDQRGQQGHRSGQDRFVQIETARVGGQHLIPVRGMKRDPVEIGAHAQMQAERATIIRVLKDVRGNKRKCAKVLRIDYTTLFDKIKKYRIDKDLG